METPERHLPPIDEIWDWIVRMNELGPRLTGNLAHQRFVDFLASGFAADGLEVARDSFRVDRWDARRWRLSSNGADIPVSSYYPGSGSTTPEGVSGPLEYLGHVTTAEASPEKLRGRIAVVDYSTGANPNDKRLWGAYDPGGDGSIPKSWSSGHKDWVRLEQLRIAAGRAGARALVVCWDNMSEDNAAHQYQPLLAHSVHEFLGEQEAVASDAPDLPALWLGQAARARVLALAREGASATLVLEAERYEARTDSVVATLPGSSSETMVLITHTDGLNAAQENGGVGLLALARCFARVPKSQRRRTLVFAAATAHFASGLRDAASGKPALAEGEGVLERHPQIRDNAVLCVGVEHLGMTEWLEEGGRFHATGKNAWAHCITSQRKLAEVMLESFRGTDSHPVMVIDGKPVGLPHPLAAAGIPTVTYIHVGDHIMSAPPDGHLGKLSKRRLYGELQALARALARFDAMPREALRE
jgi:hypothetical protein